MKTQATAQSNSASFAGISNGTIAGTAKDTSIPAGLSNPFPVTKHAQLLSADAALEIAKGRIPDFRQVCSDLFNTFHSQQAAWSALQFVPVLQQVNAIEEARVLRFLRNPKTRHVLVENDLLKVVLIHWKPGEISSIHGHPSGGCVFKVLQGSVEELRYTTDASPKLLSVSTYQAGSMAYIDDNMAYHAVGNPFNAPAISLHAYTPGRK